MKQFIAGSITGIGMVGIIWAALIFLDMTKKTDEISGIATAQSAKKDQWRSTEAGTVPTEFGEVIHVNGTSGNYTLVFEDQEKVIRLVDLRGGKIPPRVITIKRKY